MPDVTTHVLFWRILLENQHNMVPALSDKCMYQHISKIGVTHVKPALKARVFQKFHKERFQIPLEKYPMFQIEPKCICRHSVLLK